jgi:hypothetical protein
MANPIKAILGAATKETVDAVVNVVDKFVQTPEEKEAVRNAVEQEISSRWSADMSSDSWLSKNIRPLTLASVMVFLILITFFDGMGILEINQHWIGLWEMVSITVIGGYFAVRTVDKRTKVK